MFKPYLARQDSGGSRHTAAHDNGHWPSPHAGNGLAALIRGASSDSIDSMATLTIRQLDEKTKTRLRVRAAYHGRSMEEEAREILRSALTASSPVKGNLAEAIHRRFAALGGLELELPRRDDMRQVPGFAE
jgi:plasmid stability protein